MSFVPNTDLLFEKSTLYFICNFTFQLFWRQEKLILNKNEAFHSSTKWQPVVAGVDFDTIISQRGEIIKICGKLAKLAILNLNKELWIEGLLIASRYVIPWVSK